MGFIMTYLAIAIARADRRAKHVQRIMSSPALSYACKLAAINAMGGENRVML